MGTLEHIVHASTLKFEMTKGDLKDDSDKALPNLRLGIPS